MALGRPVSLKNATITLKDGSGTPNTLVVKIGEGSMSSTESHPREFKLDRGILSSGYVRDADDEPLQLTVESEWTSLVGSTGDSPTPYEFMKQQGLASAYVTTGDDCDPYCIDITVLLDNSECASSENETLTFSKFYVEQIDFNFDDGTLSFQGRCKTTAPTSVRA
jgi:hypothetical protein